MFAKPLHARSRRPNRHYALMLAVALSGGGVLGGLSARANTIDWNGSTSTDWTSGLNWVASGPPADSLITDVARFNQTSYANQPTITSELQVSGLLFAGSGAVTISGPGRLDLGAAGITMNAGAGPAEIDAPIQINGFPLAPANAGQSLQTWNNGSASNLAINGTVSQIRGVNLNVIETGTGQITSTTLANTNGIIGPWASFGAGASTKYLTINGGALGGLTGAAITDANAMVANTTNYDLDLSAAANPSVVTASVQANTIRYVGSAQTIQLGAGAVSLTTQGIMNAGSGKLRISADPANTGGILFGGPDLILNAANANIDVAAPIISTSGSRFVVTTGSHAVGINSIIAQGSTTITLPGPSTSTDSNTGGQVVIGDSRVLSLTTTSASSVINILAPIHDNPGGSSSILISGPGAVEITPGSFPNANDGVSDYSGGVTVTNGATVIISDFAGGSSSLGTGTLTLNGGTTVETGATYQPSSPNPVVINGDISINNLNGGLNLSNSPTTLTKSVTLHVLQNSGNFSRTLFGPINDAGHAYGITLVSAGDGISLEGANTFTGPLTINSGSVDLDNVAALNRNIVVNLNAGATMSLDNGISGGFIAGLNDGPGGGGTLDGGNNGARELIFAGSGTYSFSGTLARQLRLTKSGTGTQILSGANSNIPSGFGVSSQINLNSGTLQLNFAAPTAPASNILNNINNSTDVPSALAFGGGRLLLTGSASTANSQNFANLTLTGGSTLQLSPNSAAQPLVVSFGNIQRLDTSGGSLNIVLPAGAQSATNGVVSTAANINGILGGYTTVTTSAGTNWATSGAAQITGINWSVDDSDEAVVINGVEPNGAAVSFSGISGAGSGLIAGQIYYVVGSDNATQYKVVNAPSQSSPVQASGDSGTLNVSIAGNITAYTGYLTHPANGSVGSDPTNNYLLTGSAILSASENLNSLKITTTAAGQSLDLGGNSLTLSGSVASASYNVSGLLFTGANDYTIGSAAGGTLAFPDELIIHQFGAGKLTITANISGWELTKSGPGTLILTGTNFLHGNQGRMDLNGGILNINSLAAIDTGGPTTTFNGGTLQYATGFSGSGDITTRPIIINGGGATIDTNGNDITFANTFGGTNSVGGLTKAGAGKLTLPAISNYNGPTTISGGILSIAALPNGGVAGPIGTTLYAAENLVLDGGTLQYTGAAASTDRNFTLTQNGGAMDASGASNAALVFTNTSPIAATGPGIRTLTLTGTSTGLNTLGLAVVDPAGVSGPLSLGASPASGLANTTALAKTGGGTWALTNANTYTGGTTISAGTLLASNTAGSATGTANVTMNGGVLGGAGKVAGTVVGGTGAHTIAPSATLAGNTATTLTLGGLTTNAQTTLAFNLNTPFTPSAASVNDKLLVNGTVNITGGGSLAITNNNTGQPSLGYYKAIGYTTLTGPAAHTPNLGITMPAIVNSISYVLDTAHDAGFIDIHRGFLGDANDDGIVNAIDLGILATNFNSTSGNWSLGDYNGDGIVNAIDLGILATNFNGVVGGGSFTSDLESFPTLEAAFFGGASSSSVPEPASLALLGIGAAALLGRRRNAD